MTLSERLTQARIAAGLSIGQAAALMDLPKAVVQSHELDDILPPPYVLDEYAALYRVGREWLGLEGVRHAPPDALLHSPQFERLPADEQAALVDLLGMIAGDLDTKGKR